MARLSPARAFGRRQGLTLDQPERHADAIGIFVGEPMHRRAATQAEVVGERATGIGKTREGARLTPNAHTTRRVVDAHAKRRAGATLARQTVAGDDDVRLTLELEWHLAAGAA